LDVSDRMAAELHSFLSKNSRVTARIFPALSLCILFYRSATVMLGKEIYSARLYLRPALFRKFNVDVIRALGVPSR
jgi:hypothetical protein